MLIYWRVILKKKNMRFRKSGVKTPGKSVSGLIFKKVS
jgi:hypothetical protein